MNVERADLFVARDPLGDERLNVLGRGVPALPQHDEGGRDLAGLVVGKPDDRGVRDIGMGEQQGLELGRRDLESLVLDQLLEPVDDVDVAVRVDLGDVARVQPAVGVDRRRRRRRDC